MIVLSYSDGELRCWSKSAIDCYKRGCICRGCPIYELYFNDKDYVCKMKGAVLAMVRKFGIPEELKNYKNPIIEDENG